MKLDAWLVVLTLLPLQGVAHHGSNANPALYLADDLVELEGEIAGVFWRNPHPRLRIATDERSEGSVWELELPSSVIGLERRWGITAESFQLGDRVTAAGMVSRRDSQSIGVLHLLLPNGQELVNGNRENRWSAERVASLDPKAVTEEPTTSIFRVWGSSVGGQAIVSFSAPSYEELYTERGRQAATAFNRVTDDPELNCRQGFPGAMLSPAPWEIVDEGDRIRIRLQEFDLQRIVYLDVNTLPDDPPTSPLGLSIGHWEDDTLVISTTLVDWPYFDRGTPQSDQATHIERLTVSEDGTELDYSVVSNDPVMYREPIAFRVTWAWVPGTEVEPYNCAAEWEGSSVEG